MSDPTRIRRDNDRDMVALARLYEDEDSDRGFLARQVIRLADTQMLRRGHHEANAELCKQIGHRGVVVCERCGRSNLYGRLRQEGEFEGREGIVTVYDHEGRYLGCMGIETWGAALATQKREAGARALRWGALPAGEGTT